MIPADRMRKIRMSARVVRSSFFSEPAMVIIECVRSSLRLLRLLRPLRLLRSLRSLPHLPNFSSSQLLSFLNRQLDDECRPALIVVLRPDRSAMIPDDAIGNSETDALPLVRVLGGEEGIKDSGLVRLTDPMTRI